MKDATVLITGGAGNIGRVVSRIFLESGARIVVPFHGTDHSDALDELRVAHAERLHAFALDLTTQRGAEAAVREAVEWGGQLDAVVHLVGGYSGGRRLADTPPEVWERMMDLNLKSAWLVARAALPVLVGGGGSFVFVSSRAARQGRRGNGAYAVSKAGLLTLMETIAEEYRDDGIRANAVLPGTVDTEANRAAMPDAPHDRWTRPEEIARVIYFLASPEASAVTGASVPVPGRS